MIERERIQVFFPIEFRVAKADLCWLSPMYGRESAIISLHVFRFTDQRRYFEKAEAIFRAHGGRPHWGKVHNIDRAQAVAYYPKWKDFEALREDMDPDGIFLNLMLKKLFSTTPRRADSGA
jgi:FAD/FMN-containing dehydrogenase